MRVFKTRRFNIEAAIKIVILWGFALFYLFTILMGKAQLYVHPRIIPYIMFGVVAMILISGSILSDVFKPPRIRRSLVNYLFFLVPLFLAFSLPVKSMDSTSMAIADIGIGQQSINSSQNNISGSAVPNNTSSSIPNNKTSSDSAAPSNNTDLNNNKFLLEEKNANSSDSTYKPGETIIIDDDNFVKWTEEIYENMDKYDGAKIQLVGFVLKDMRMKANEFVPARFMMTCCTADMQAIGLLCQYDKASEIKKDSWVKVTGTIKETEFEGQIIPLFHANSVVGVEKPKNDYVYPY